MKSGSLEVLVYQNRKRVCLSVITQLSPLLYTYSCSRLPGDSSVLLKIDCVIFTHGKTGCLALRRG